MDYKIFHKGEEKSKYLPTAILLYEDCGKLKQAYIHTQNLNPLDFQIIGSKKLGDIDGENLEEKAINLSQIENKPVIFLGFNLEVIGNRTEFRNEYSSHFNKLLN